MSKGKSPKKAAAPKAAFSFKRHIVPPICGVIIMLLVFAGLNAQLLTAQVRYHAASTSTVAPTSTPTAPSPDTNVDPNVAPELTIPRINIHAPIVFDEPSVNEYKVQLALRRGVLHYGNTAVPGQKGNVVILGHSSGRLWTPGDYKFVFTLLDRMQTGDTFSLTYKGTRYTYKITNSQVIAPTDVSVLDQPTDKNMISLITCTPVGTDKKRLVVSAEQISPLPKVTKPTVTKTTPYKPTKLPASEHTPLWQTIRNWF